MKSADFGGTRSDRMFECLRDMAADAPLLLNFLENITMSNAATERQRDSKAVATYVILSMLLSTRNREYPGVAKVLGLISTMSGVPSNFHQILNKTRICCSHRTATNILDSTDYMESIKQVSLLACAVLILVQIPEDAVLMAIWDNLNLIDADKYGDRKQETVFERVFCVL